jgi:hypothetical protein
MTWDVLFVRLPLSVMTMSELPRGYVFAPFGTRESVVADLERACARQDRSIDWMSPSFGVVRTDDFIVEIDLGAATRPDRVLLSVQGAARALDLLDVMASALGAKAVDVETDRVVEFDDRVTASSGLESWQERRAAEVATDRESQSLLDEGVEVIAIHAGPKSPRN